MRRDYESWLQGEKYDPGTIQAQLYRVTRVERHHGDLDQHYDEDRLAGLIMQLSYSTHDQRAGRANPSLIPIAGNLRKSLASYKSAVLWYQRFRELDGEPSGNPIRTTAIRIVEQQAPIAGTIQRPEHQLIVSRTGPRTLVDFQLNGRAALDAIIASSQYRTMAQAVAALTLFSHPLTVQQTDGKALFPTIRNQRRVGQIDDHNGRQVLLDDNKSPKDAFLWANGLPRRGPDTQFNHVYSASVDPDAYTALQNICMTPAFIAKLTDTSEEICRLLRFRSYQLYGWFPAGATPPDRPDEYEALEWAAPLPPIADLRKTLLAAMATKPRDRTVMAAKQIGWLFG